MGNSFEALSLSLSLCPRKDAKTAREAALRRDGAKMEREKRAISEEIDV